VVFPKSKGINMTPEEIARVAHEANRAVTQIVQDVPVQPSWDEIDPDMRASCIKGVAFGIEHPATTAEEMHEEWCKERRAQGWVLGDVKDPEKKTHPALRPYHELSLGTRQKDVVFRAIIQAFR
jgi:hypothetical protein